METDLELTLPEALKPGRHLLPQDHSEAAEGVYCSVIAQHPGQPDALHYLGLNKHGRVWQESS